MGMRIRINHYLSPSPVRIRTRVLSQLQEQQELIRSGTIRAVPAKDAAAAMRGEGFRLLDIRPAWEREKARVKDSLHVPLFVEDTDMGPITLVKKWVHFGYIGLWTGQKFTTIDDRFVQRVEEIVPDKEDKLLVACGEGLRVIHGLAYAIRSS